MAQHNSKMLQKLQLQLIKQLHPHHHHHLLLKDWYKIEILNNFSHHHLHQRQAVLLHQKLQVLQFPNHLGQLLLHNKHNLHPLKFPIHHNKFKHLLNHLNQLFKNKFNKLLNLQHLRNKRNQKHSSRNPDKRNKSKNKHHFLFHKNKNNVIILYYKIKNSKSPMLRRLNFLNSVKKNKKSELK